MANVSEMSAVEVRFSFDQDESPDILSGLEKLLSTLKTYQEAGLEISSRTIAEGVMTFKLVNETRIVTKVAPANSLSPEQ